MLLSCRLCRASGCNEQAVTGSVKRAFANGGKF